MLNGRSGAREQLARIPWRLYPAIGRRFAPVFEDFLPEEAADIQSATGEQVT